MVATGVLDAKGGVAMQRLWLRLVPAALGVCVAATVGEAGSARSSFGVTAEVVRRCTIDGGATDPRVACPKGMPAPRVSTAPLPAAGASPSASSPRVIESAAPDGTIVTVNVDF